MKIKKIFLSFFILLSILLSQTQLLANDAIQDNFMRGVFKYLAKNRDMNLIAYSGENIADIGKLYYIEEPENHKILTKWSKSGKALKLFLYDKGCDLNGKVIYQKEENYIIGTTYSDYLGVELKATLQRKGISIKAFKDALGKAQISFKVIRKVVAARTVSNSIQKMKGAIIRDFDRDDLGEGIIMPFQQLIVADFKYNETMSANLTGLLGADVLKFIKGKFTIQTIKMGNTNITLPVSSTIAIKPFTVYFKKESFWGRWF